MNNTLLLENSAVINPETMSTIYDELEAIKKLESCGIARTLHGFYYISHYYPLRAMQETSQDEIKNRLLNLESDKFEIYFHFPFCDQICGFCHFYKRIKGHDFIQREEKIVGALCAEQKLYKDLFGQKIKAKSIQFGGGTPSLISNNQLKRLLESIDKNMEIESGAELKIEVYPKDYPAGELEEKLRILKDFGVTDIVVDLESGNQQTLDYINRKNSSLDKYLRVVDKCISAGFKNIVSALMVGLPYENLTSLHSTIEVLTNISEVTVINTFPTIWRPTDAMAIKTFKHRDAFVSADERDLQFIYARKLLRSKGFVEGPIAFFHREDKRSEQQSDKFECVNLLGFGISAFGYLNGSDWASQYYNYCNWDDYIKKISQGEFAIWKMGFADQEERARRKLIFGLANVKTENLVAIEKRFGIDINQVFGKELNALLDLGLIEIDKNNLGVKFTDSGLMRLEEIGYFLSSKHVKDSHNNFPNKSEAYAKELVNQQYFPTIPVFHRTLFEKYSSRYSSDIMSKITGT